MSWQKLFSQGQKVFAILQHVCTQYLCVAASVCACVCVCLCICVLVSVNKMKMSLHIKAGWSIRDSHCRKLSGVPTRPKRTKMEKATDRRPNRVKGGSRPSEGLTECWEGLRVAAVLQLSCGNVYWRILASQDDNQSRTMSLVCQ